MTEDDLIARAKHAIESGAAICLLGAGFSIHGSDSIGRSVPGSSQLTDEIKKLLGVPDGEVANLTDVADFANEIDDGVNKLNQYLVQRLTSSVPSESQKRLVSLNWRALFTTNFDDIIEQVGVKDRIVVRPSSVAGGIPADKTPIYYMHGRALDLRESDINPSLILSESNYLNIQKNNRDLYAKFFNEIVCARAIVIAGYSLKDLEIASGLLSAGVGIRDKTFIVTSSEDTDFTVSRLRKFGHILRLGLDGFVDAIERAEGVGGQIETLQFLRELEFGPGADENEAEDFLSLILTGNFDGSRFQRQLISENEPYCVERAQLTSVRSAGVNRFWSHRISGMAKVHFYIKRRCGKLSVGHGYF